MARRLSLYGTLFIGLSTWACAREQPSRLPTSTRVRSAAVTRRAPDTGCSDEERRRAARKTLRGSASYYHDSLSGNLTASGQRYDPDELSAAHRSLPFGTRVRVRRADMTSSPVCVTINDRGPFAGKNRVIDLSRRAAEHLNMLGAGVVPVEVEVL